MAVHDAFRAPLVLLFTRYMGKATMQWKVLVLRYASIQTPTGVRTETPEKMNAIPDAFQRIFADKARSNTDGRLTLDITLAPVVAKLVPATPYSSTWWPSWVEVRADLDAIPWGAYDSIFVLAPYEGVAGGFQGLGTYSPMDTRGATYATLPTGVTLSDCEGDWMTHEFLHGACGFFMGLGYAMPQPSNPPAGQGLQDGVHVGGEYYKDPVTGKDPACFTAFYRDLMRGESRPTGNLGIPLSAWELGTPRNVDALAGRDSSDPAGFRSAVPELLPAWPVVAPGRPDARSYRVGDGGERQYFKGPNGDSFIMKGPGLGTFAVRPAVFSAFMRAGGWAVVGYPTNALHDWGAGKAQDFRGPGGNCAIMQGTGRDPYVVLPRIWQTFLNEGGATAVGYPTNDLHDWAEGKIQDFTGPSGTWAVMQGTGRDPYAVVPRIWSAFLQGGGAPALGYPTNALHDWGAGKIQNFRLASGWECGVMSGTGRSDAFTVKGLIWKHYTSRGGATSYLGYPTSSETTVSSGGRSYWQQSFVGGRIRVDQQTHVAEDLR